MVTTVNLEWKTNNPFVILEKTGREGMNKNTIKDALDLQQKIISALRKGS